MITFCRLRPARTVNPAWAVTRRAEGDTAVEIADPSADGVAAAVAGGLLPVAIGPSVADVAAWVVQAADAGALSRRGIPGWRLTIVPGTRFARPRKRATQDVAGLPYTACGVPSWRMCPCCMMATRSATEKASCWSWVT